MENLYERFKNEFDKQIKDSLRDLKNYRELNEKTRNDFFSSILENNLYKAFSIAKNYSGEDRAKLFIDVIELSTKLGNISVAIESAKIIGINLDIMRLDVILKFNLERGRLDSVKQTLQYIPAKFRLSFVNLYARELYKTNRESLANNLLAMYINMDNNPPAITENNGGQGNKKKKRIAN